MEHRRVPCATPAWYFLSRRELHDSVDVGGIQYRSLPVARVRSRVRRYTLKADAPQVPWAASVQPSLHAVFGDDKLGQLAGRLLTSGLASTSLSTYGSCFNSFLEYCREDGIQPLAATPAHIIRYTAWLGERGTVSAASLQPYYSVVNAFFQDHGLKGPAQGPRLSAARRGLQALQVDGRAQPMRLPIPADVVYQFFRLAQQLLPSLSWTSVAEPVVLLRNLLACIFCFAFLGRGGSGGHVLARDIAFTDTHFLLYLSRQKGRDARRLHERSKFQVPRSAVPGLAALFEAYAFGRLRLFSHAGLPPSDFFWSLPGDGPGPFSSADVTSWLTACCAAVGASVPAGQFGYSSHSLRGGGASAANAAGVPLSVIRHVGGWSASSLVVERDYIDPTVLHSRGGGFFFDWLTPAGQLALQPAAPR